MTSRPPNRADKAGHWQTCSANPEMLLQFRQQAFASGDFGQVWDCYHPDSNFRRAFPDRAAYEEYGRMNLASQFVLTGWRILKQQVEVNRSQVLVLNTFTREDEPLAWFEWIRLIRVGAIWGIMEIARLERHRYPGPVETFDWKDFERLSDMIFF